ncbi:envelope stress response membrane protein PspB [Pseudobacteriovorax antillogorgiicola]|uniref:Phage shock protein B n=1 Tax=Pseudobacteriovorax antillogorgiicola TaxID=1513793 RepID=A0A1Y6BVA2_9BACT|nr:envelope stress response membrane protein PspB [Pseudobacteriovorax antillogorgiicola]TCS52398.1 phage shock protein B [Pseudobacteriovorax antillogorgiicola]SMF29033.1 phage shock protein B [Pseudobacteriovorax antillogorgiicola]
MENLESIVAIVCIFVICPLIVFHYVFGSRRTVSNDDGGKYQELQQKARLLEDRIQTLERILDREYPRWRKS